MLEETEELEERERALQEALTAFEMAEDFQGAVSGLLQLSKLVDTEPANNEPIKNALIQGCESRDTRIFEMSRKLFLGVLDFGYIELSEGDRARLNAIRDRKLEEMGFEPGWLGPLSGAEFVTLRFSANWATFMDALYDVISFFEAAAAGKERDGDLQNENEVRLKLMNEQLFAPMLLQRADDETDPDLLSLESNLFLAVTQPDKIDLQIHPSHSMRYGLTRYGGDSRKLEDYAFLIAKSIGMLRNRLGVEVEVEFPG